jgi:hypothetical protein
MLLTNQKNGAEGQPGQSLEIFQIDDIQKDRGDNPLQDSAVKESAIRIFSETRHPTLITLRLN